MLDLCPQTLVWRAVAGEGWCGWRRGTEGGPASQHTRPMQHVFMLASAQPFLSQRLPSPLEGRGHPVPPGGSRLRLQENELMCAQLDCAMIRGDVEWIHA